MQRFDFLTAFDGTDLDNAWEPEALLREYLKLMPRRYAILYIVAYAKAAASLAFQNRIVHGVFERIYISMFNVLLRLFNFKAEKNNLKIIQISPMCAFRGIATEALGCRCESGNQLRGGGRTIALKRPALHPGSVKKTPGHAEEDVNPALGSLARSSLRSASEVRRTPDPPVPPLDPALLQQLRDYLWQMQPEGLLLVIEACKQLLMAYSCQRAAAQSLGVFRSSGARVA